MNQHFLIASCAIPMAMSSFAQAAGTVDENTELALRRDAAERTTMLDEEPAKVKINGRIQFRYQANFRDDNGLVPADNDTTIGFSLRRVKITTTAQVTDNMTAYVTFAFSRSSGNATLEDAKIKWKLNDNWVVNFGQFKIPLLREEMISSKRQLAVERSATNETLNQDFGQGVEFIYDQDKWQAMFMISDGFNTDNTVFTHAREADIALTGRVEILLGDAKFKQFKQFTSFRGASQGAMVGVAGHWQTMGDTNPSTANSTDLTEVTADFSYVGNGWNAFAAGIWRNMDVTATTSRDDFGVVVQGGVFITDASEIFIRYDGFFPDDFAGATDFNTLTVGMNHYFSPESHAAKFTIDCGYHFDAVNSSGIATSDSHNLLADTNDGQFGISAQLQLLF